MRLFVDTNVLFDIFAQRKPFQEEAAKIMAMQVLGDAEIWSAPQSVLDIFYVMSKTVPSADLQRALDAGLERINLCATDHQDVRDSLRAGWDDAEDALIGALCKKVRADYLLTRDKAQLGFRSLGIPVFTPAEFFDHLERELGISYAEVNLCER